LRSADRIANKNMQITKQNKSYTQC